MRTKNAGLAAGEDGKLKWKNFQWWDNSLWLPLEFDDPGRINDDPTFFVGSCPSLIAELDELKRTSPLQLGEVVSQYSDMRADFVKFIRSDAELDLSADDCGALGGARLRRGPVRVNSGLMQCSEDGNYDPVTPGLDRISCEPDSFRRITRHYTARGYEA